MLRFRSELVMLSVALLAVAATPAGARTAGVTGASCGPAWGIVKSANNTDFDRNTLRGVSAQSDTNVLAVGNSASEVGPGPDVLAERWDGSSWTLVSAVTPNDEAELNDVHFIGASDAWAVGQTYTGSYWQTLVERWNGTSFARVASPNRATSSGSLNLLEDVGGTAGDSWAVGETGTITTHEAPLILHWSGSSWARTSNPADPGSGDYSLNGVTRLSASRAWAVGSFDNGSRDVPMVLRWNGTAWSVVSGVPRPGTGNARLLAVRALSSTNVWAVGFFIQSGHTHTLVLHFDGSTWSRVSSPDFFTGNALNDVAIRTGQDIWAVGETDEAAVGGPTNTLVLHWDGTSWRRVVSPNRTPTNDELNAVAVVEGGSNVWAVGSTNQTLAMSLCPVRVGDGGFTPPSATVDVGSSVAWALPVANVQNHSVTDASGLGEFDSGPLGNGASFIHTFGAAGSHAIVDTVTGNGSTIDVLPTVDPTSGDASTSFLVTWATHDSQAPIVHDVQVKGPSDGSFLTWMASVTNADGGFIPNAWQGGEGPGVYKFRARLRDKTTGAMTGWSPAVKITVS